MLLQRILCLVFIPCFPMAGPTPEYHYLALAVKRPALSQGSTQNTYKLRGQKKEAYLRLPQSK